MDGILYFVTQNPPFLNLRVSIEVVSWYFQRKKNHGIWKWNLTSICYKGTKTQTLSTTRDLSPEESESSVQEGPIDGLSILYVVDKPKLDFQKYNSTSPFLKMTKTFIVWQLVRDVLRDLLRDVLRDLLRDVLRDLLRDELVIKKVYTILLIFKYISK